MVNITTMYCNKEIGITIPWIPSFLTSIIILNVLYTFYILITNIVLLVGKYKGNTHIRLLLIQYKYFYQYN